MLQKQPLRGLRSNKFSNISAYKTKVKPLLTAVVDKSEKKTLAGNETYLRIRNASWYLLVQIQQ